LLTVLLIVLYFNNWSVGNLFSGEWEVVKHRIPLYIFIVITLVLSILGFVKQFSLIPVLGVLSNAYLMTELGLTNWLRFLAWLLIGLSLYFLYGIRHSKERHSTELRH